MLEAALTDQKCDFCGVEVREGTAFCFNCGKPVNIETESEESFDAETIAIPKPDSPADEALADLADKLDREREDNEKLAKAAADRKKARTEKKAKKVEVWATPDSDSVGIAALVTILMLLVTLAVVFLTVWIK